MLHRKRIVYDDSVIEWRNFFNACIRLSVYLMYEYIYVYVCEKHSVEEMRTERGVR